MNQARTPWRGGVKGRGKGGPGTQKNMCKEPGVGESLGAAGAGRRPGAAGPWYGDNV